MTTIAQAPSRDRIDVDAYYRMAEAGLLREADRVELIDGEIIATAPIGTDHASIVGRLNKLLVLTLGDDADVWPQNPVRIDRSNEPQPDLSLLRPEPDTYRSRHPQPRDVLLLIEVADSSLDYDRSTKRDLYARAGIAEYWIVDVAGRTVQVYREPGGDGYAWVRIYAADETITLALLPGIAIPLGRILA